MIQHCNNTHRQQKGFSFLAVVLSPTMQGTSQSLQMSSSLFLQQPFNLLLQYRSDMVYALMTDRFLILKAVSRKTRTTVLAHNAERIFGSPGFYSLASP